MPTSARMMVELRTCGGATGACVCTTAPLNPHGGPSQVQASAKPTTVAVHPHLLQRLAKCGFTKCEDPENRLSAAQFQAVLADQSVADRIAYKQLITQAGIWPADPR